MPGGLIVRKFRSETIVVQVVDKGFEYRDCRYSSLSAIAQAYHVSWQKLYQENTSVIGGDPNLILPGQKLSV